jgi:hypothetical protein
MYNLLVSGNRIAWNGEPYVFSSDRLFEYTAKNVADKYRDLTAEQIEDLIRLPTVFAYEKGHDLDAKIGKIDRVRVRGKDIRVEYHFLDDVPPITHDQLNSLVWELDIGDGELYRTHWALKNVDLTRELRVLDAINDAQVASMKVAFGQQAALAQKAIPVAPTVFRVPDEPVDQTLVSVMMPFSPDFAQMFATVRGVCEELGLRCQNANDVWHESEIIQDIFSLIYRSKIVICDFSGKNANVFYEAGVAHTLGRSVIPIVRSIDDIPFDLRAHRHILYLNNAEGLAKLRADLLPRLKSLAGG